ncbi:MAG: MTH1187 family thiamine-binding protein [Desulfobulbaceae bacterium]|nr:MTH1187 family thiamine-binding protein [Desulfobulbaceae bacterium]
MALMQITIIPLGTSTPSVGDYVAGVQEFLEEREVEYQLCDMGTVIHGTAPELLNLAAEVHEYPFRKGVERVVTNIVLDDRRDKAVGIGEKRAAVLRRLKR